MFSLKKDYQWMMLNLSRNNLKNKLKIQISMTITHKIYMKVEINHWNKLNKMTQMDWKKIFLN
jgi:hypothetical protein